MTWYTLRFNVFKLATVKKFDYPILAGKLKFGKKQSREIFQMFLIRPQLMKG